MARARKKKPRSAEPRSAQTRPTISFRTYRADLAAMDAFADDIGCTRNDLIDAMVTIGLTDRTPVTALVAQRMEARDERQTRLDFSPSIFS